MQRTAMKFLSDWLHNSSHRLPLVLRGARQVGKTWLVRHLAETEGKRLIEINFEERKELFSLFTATNDPKKIVQALEDALEMSEIVPQKSILFLDEVQALPAVYSKLRWFAEKMPELPVVAAGSLLEFVLENEALSIPVGRVQYMYLEPLSFEEFLLAHNRNQLVGIMARFTWKDEISQITHDTLMGLFKEYVLVGGMPAAVKQWLASKSLKAVSEIQKNIITGYREDFKKYSGRISEHTMNATLARVLASLGKKFVYSKVDDNAPIPTIKKALSLLCKARVCHKVLSTDANGIPLAAESNEKYIKALYLDVGLCSAAFKLSMQDLTSVNDLTLVNSGGIAEQVVGQLLRTIEPEYIDPELYYWVRHKAGTNAEVDYIIQHANAVVPLEVKAGKTGVLRSLHTFVSLKQTPRALRIYSGMPSISNINTRLQDGKKIAYTLYSIPMYLVGEMHRLLESN